MNNITATLAQFLRSYWQDAVCVLSMLLLSFCYFQTPTAEGLTLGGHDAEAAMAQGRELADYHERTGEVSRWMGTMFSGMPTYQTSPSYGPTDLLAKVRNFIGLGADSALAYVFLFMLGFYILLRAFNFRPYLCALGAVLWAFSSYFFIIIAAGHIWKVLTLCFVPPTLAGLVLCYRGRLLWGGAVTALFTALQVLCNHVQMTYYFFLLMLLLSLCLLVSAALHRELRQWLRATLVALLCGALGLAVNLPNLYHTYQYTKLSMRGPSELSATPLPSGTLPASASTGRAPGTHAPGTTPPARPPQGLSFDYITQWSYGIDETLTLLIPDSKGGGSGNVLEKEGVNQDHVAALYPYLQPAQQALAKADVQRLAHRSGAESVLPGVNAYWGNQPMTVGPVYVGALVCFLFVLGLFVVRGRRETAVKWALLLGTVVSLLLCWGRNVPALTQWLIDHMPLYNKFRTPSSALVVAELTMPLMAVMCLWQIMRQPSWLRSWRGRAGLIAATALTVVPCLVLWLVPTAAGPCLSAGEATVLGAFHTTGALSPDMLQGYTQAITTLRQGVVAHSAGCSLLVLALGLLLLLLYERLRSRSWAPAALSLALLCLCLADLWSVCRCYLNDDNFSEPSHWEANFQPTPADGQILAAGDHAARVLDLSQGDPFNQNHTSYLHRSIGGYHAAKLHRYQDLIDHRLRPEIDRLVAAAQLAGGDMSQVRADSLAPTLCMLNTRYLLFGPNTVLENPQALGAAWFVSELRLVDDADAEMAALSSLQPGRQAVADKRFQSELCRGGGMPRPNTPGTGTARLTRYEPNEQHYSLHCPQGGLLVLSEIYYPGWTAQVDGRPVSVGRVNYVLRAVRLPAGAKSLVLTFRPASVARTEAVGYAALLLILLLWLAALLRCMMHEA